MNFLHHYTTSSTAGHIMSKSTLSSCNITHIIGHSLMFVSIVCHVMHASCLGKIISGLYKLCSRHVRPTQQLHSLLTAYQLLFLICTVIGNNKYNGLPDTYITAERTAHTHTIHTCNTTQYDLIIVNVDIVTAVLLYPSS